MPEAINGKAWKVVQTAPAHDMPEGYTDPINNEMGLPPAGAANEQFVRMHELMHAAITPGISPAKLCAKHGFNNHDLQCVEDLRIATALYRKNLLPSDMGCSTPQTHARLVDQIANSADKHAILESYAHLMLQHTTAVPRGLHGPLKLYDEFRKMHDDVIIAINKRAIVLPEMPTTDDHGELLRVAHRIGKMVGQTLSGKRKTTSGEIPTFKLTIKAAKLLRKLLSQAHEAIDSDDETIKRHMHSLMGHKNATRKANWGKLSEIRKLHLEKQRKIEGDRRKRSMMIGTRVGTIHRLLTDGRAFKRPTRRNANKGGTFIIDASGSMNISTKAIANILEKAPAAKVAIYCGYGDAGKIAIVAEQGRMANENAIRHFRDETGQGNIIDGPVLKWLGTQTQPRIWICDGYVTGVNDDQHSELSAEALRLSKLHDIKRIEHLEALKEMLK